MTLKEEKINVEKVIELALKVLERNNFEGPANECVNRNFAKLDAIYALALKHGWDVWRHEIK